MARVEKNAAAHRYEMQVEGHTALVQYRDERDGAVRLIHTEVPDALAGRGVGSSLAKGVLEAVRGRRSKGCTAMHVHRRLHRSASRVSGPCNASHMMDVARNSARLWQR